MKAVRAIAVAVGLVMMLAVSSQAAPVTLTLQRTTALFNEDPPGAPAPLARTQYDAGNVLFNGQKIGEYLWVKDVHAAGMNTSSVKLTLFFPNAGGATHTVVLQGSHDFSSGDGLGSVSASSFAGLVGVTYSSDSSVMTVPLNLP